MHIIPPKYDAYGKVEGERVSTEPRLKPADLVVGLVTVGFLGLCCRAVTMLGPESVAQATQWAGTLAGR